MDLDYQAIPHDSPALEQARRDGIFGCELEFWSSYAKPNAQYDAMARHARSSQEQEDAAFVDLLRIARQAASQHPGLEGRTFHWNGRGYDAVHYLLSPARRAAKNWQSAPDWAGEAIFGAQVLHPTAVTTIGFKIRYTSPELVREHAELLQIVTQDDLREHFNAAEMARFGVYKYFGEAERFETWMWPEFEAWRGFVVSMLDFPDEGLLCCIG